MSSTATSLSSSLARRRLVVLAKRLIASVVRGERPAFALLQSVGMQVFVAVITMGTGIITARALGPEGRGIFAALTTWPQLLATLAVSGLNSAIVVRMRKHPQSAGAISAAGLLLSTTTSLVAIAVGIALMPVLMRPYGQPLILFAQCCLLAVLVISSHQVIKQVFAGLREFRQLNLANLRPQVYYLVALGVLLFGTIGARDAVLAMLGTGALSVLVVLPRFIRLARPRLAGVRAELAALSSYASRAAATDFVFTLATYADRLVLIPMLSAGALGIYAVAFSFSRIIQLAQPAIVSVILSHMSGQAEADSKRLHDNACRVLLACLVPGCVLLWLAGKPLLTLAYGAQFGAAHGIFTLLIVEASLGILSQVTVQLFLSRERPGVVSAIQVVVLCFSVAALLILVPRYDAFGAAVGLLAAGVLRWVLLLGALKVILRMPLPRLYLTREDFRYVIDAFRKGDS